MNQTLPKTDLEKKVFEVLSHKNWGASSTILNELARDTYDYEKYNVIMKLMWEAMDGRPAAWRQVFKSLTLLEHLIKNGSDRAVEDARSHGHKIRSLYNFNYYEGTTDRGVGVREKAKQIMEVLQDNDRVREERQKARQLREKFGGGMGMSGVGSNGGKYEGYGNDSYSGGSGYGNGGIDSRGYSSSRGYSGRYSDERTNTASASLSTTNGEKSSSSDFAAAPEPKPTKVKKVKKKKEKIESVPAAAAPEIDLFSFDEVPAPTPAVAPAPSVDDSFDAFQGATPISAQPTETFDAFGSNILSQSQQVQSQPFDAFGSASLSPNNMTQNVAMNQATMIQQPMMMASNSTMQQHNQTANSSIMGGGKVQKNKASATVSDFGDFSSAPANGDDGFGDFSGAENGSNATSSGNTPSNGASLDPMSRLIALDSLVPNKKSEPNPALQPIPAPVAITQPMMAHSSFQMAAPPAPKSVNNPDSAFSGIDGLNKPVTNLMAPVPAKKMSGQSVMMQQNGPSVIDTMGMPSPTQTINKNIANPMQQMMYGQQMAHMPNNAFGMNQAGMNMMYNPQQQSMMLNMQTSGMGMQQINPMMMMNMQMGNMNNMNQQQGGFAMGGQGSDKSNMLGGQIMGEGGGFR